MEIYLFLIHIINIFSKFGHSDYYIATGYKSQIIKNFFKSKSKKFKIINKNHSLAEWTYKGEKININLINTGMNSMTGGRILKLKKYLNDENFLLTYGDGLANINITKELIKFHSKKNKIATLTAVRPPARFGELNLKIL